MMRIALGYPPPDAERTLLSERDRRDLLPEIQPALQPTNLLELQAQVNTVKATPALLEYVLSLVRYTRQHSGLRMGLSPRAGLAIRRASQAWALINGRGGAIPEDVQAVFSAVVGHRLVATAEREAGAPTPEEILAAVAIP
jgi:MoxR-like ATPase